MSTLAELERRITAVEAAVAELRERPRKSLDLNWLERVAGKFADDPDYDEVARLGREAGEAQRNPGDSEP